MSNVPSSTLPVPPYATPATARAAPARPTSVLVLSILGLILGGGSLLCAPLSIVGMVVDFGVPNPQLDAIRGDPLLKAWNWFGIATMLVLGAWLLIGSIGSIILKRWARSAMVAYAIVQITLSIATAVFTFVVIQPRLTAAMQAQSGATPPAWTQYLQMGFIALGLCFFGSILYFFTRPSTVAAFEAAEAGAV